MTPDLLEKFLAMVEQQGMFGERGGARNVELDSSLQQIIPYGYIQRSDGRFMLYQRGGEKYGEQRLADKVSIGVDGHVEPSDGSLMDGLYRELAEELSITLGGQAVALLKEDGQADQAKINRYADITIVGLLKDDRDAVGRAHIGLVYRITPKSTELVVGINADTGENVRSWYVTAKEYARQLVAHEITPGGWTDIVVANEIQRRPGVESIDPRKQKLYVGCSLTLAPQSFKDSVNELKADLRENWNVLEFLGTAVGTPGEVYDQDIIRNIGTCDAFVAIVDEPSFGVGWEAHEAAALGKPVLLLAHEDARVTRLLVGATYYFPNLHFRTYRDLRKDAPVLLAEMMREQKK